jgi:response regulator RpfG family c-di-GMP phosphodiesterase
MTNSEGILSSGNFTLSGELLDLDLAIPPLEPKILVVDDDADILKILSAVIRRHGYCCSTAANLEEARRAIEKQKYDIMFLDLVLPDGSGLNLIDPQTIRKNSIVVIITGQQRLHTAIQIIRTGAYDFIPKPFTLQIFSERLAKVVEEWRSRIRYQYYQCHLERLVNAMTTKLLETTRHIDQIYDMTVSALGAALDLRDPETEGHCRRVAENSVCLGKALGLSNGELRNLKWSAYLHDIGKIGIPENILAKPSNLTVEEMKSIKGHPLLGYKMISNVHFLKDATDVVLYHHERYDGSGYPFGLKGEEIPLNARIFAVIDTMDAIISDRPYRKALPFSHCIEEIKNGSGTQFDPDIVKKFLEIPEDRWRVEQAPKK